MATLVVTKDAMIAWKIATVPHGSEGTRPQRDAECAYFLATGTASSCASGSGGSFCGGFMGGTAGYVYCAWGLDEVIE